MIPETSITAWSQVAPWAELRQVEQDLIISRALVEIFNHDLLRSALRFRGGTALNKIIFPQPLRYSEDIDLVRTEASPIGPVLDALREVLEPWLGAGKFSPSKSTPKLRFKVATEDDPNLFIKLKVEININEIEIVDAPVCTEYSIENSWFSGRTTIQTFTVEELMATKLRALMQRDKGRDLFDLGHAIVVMPALNIDRMIAIFEHYLASDNQSIGRAEAERRMLAKFAKSDPFSDIRALLPIGAHEFRDKAAARTVFLTVFKNVIEKISGQRWVLTGEVAEKLGLVELVENNDHGV